MKTIAIQGVKGAFHHQAAHTLVPDAEILECVTFQDVFDAVENGTATHGVVAIENSLHGSINPVYRLLKRTGLWIAGETTLHVNLYLIGPKKIALTELNTPDAEVRSMFPALAESELWLHEHLPQAQRAELYDTAYSVKTVVEEQNPLHVAIAGEHAATTYGGEIIAGPINDDPHNYTRFVLLTKEPISDLDANRTSIILTVGHSEGALFNALGAFAKHSINLSKLDSHPIPADTRHYAFYIDLEAGSHTPAVQDAFTELTDMGCDIKLLGSYHT